ncbi:acetate--CoA ligase [Neoaquamicrobium sediminum]|mgnify:CR=1 FL=1|uniref:acetate--CoA ligase n=1 Tax=Neoaquamicrobium sediminum TaxID=1849104 RepID=UPI003F66E0EB
MSATLDVVSVPGYVPSFDMDAFTQMYRHSIEEPDAFWAKQALCVDWQVPFTRVRNIDIGPDIVSIKWFADGTLNACHNCVDRHVDARGDQVAILWEGDEPGLAERITYRELHGAVCRLANGLRSLGIGKGDRVAIYLPMIPEAAISMLACARLGAVHSVVFGGFSAEALAGRIRDCGARVVVTANEGVRGGRTIPLKHNMDKALESCPFVEKCIVVGRTASQVDWVEGRDIRYLDLVDTMNAECEPEWMNAEDPLFILYTSGSTGKPKGVLHTTGGYLVACALSHRHVFDYRDGDIFWCTADVGWVTGHSYIVYGPLANGATTVMFEGIPTWPTPSRFWEICDRHGVTIFYTAPTAIRALMREGDEHVMRIDRSSLRILGSVGEPINPEAWRWYFEVVGEGRCPVIDTWWQTETGTIMIAPVPGVTPLKPGSAALPFFGVEPVLVDDAGRVLEGVAEGLLCLRDAGPGIMRTIHGDPARFIETYFRRFPGLYFTGDGCRRDEDGFYWITGRIDDVINVSGHRLGTAEIEGALVAHQAVAEAAVVGYPDAVKGQGIHAFVTLKAGEGETEALRQELRDFVRRQIGAIAQPDVIQWATALPKTRSGKIMRRILRKLAEGKVEELGDVSTLVDPGVVAALADVARARKDAV